MLQKEACLEEADFFNSSQQQTPHWVTLSTHTPHFEEVKATPLEEKPARSGSLKGRKEEQPLQYSKELYPRSSSHVKESDINPKKQKTSHAVPHLGVIVPCKEFLKDKVFRPLDARLALKQGKQPGCEDDQQHE